MTPIQHAPDFAVTYDSRRNRFIAEDENGRELASVPSGESITRDCSARDLLRKLLDEGRSR